MHSAAVAIALLVSAGPPAALAYRQFDSTDAAVTANAGVADGWELVIDGARAIKHSPDEHDIETAEAALIVEGAASAPVRAVAELTFEYECGPNARSLSALLGAIWERGVRGSTPCDHV